MKVFDLHCDTVYECDTRQQSLLSNRCHVDLDRGDLFDAYGQVFAAWISDDVRGDAAWDQCCRLLQIVENTARDYPHRLRVAHGASDRQEQGIQKPPALAVLAVENGAAIGDRIERIATLSDMGVKFLTITWNGENAWGYGSLSEVSKGLKPFGKSCVRELERCGIVPDVSHLNERGFWDVANLCEKPFVATHSASMTVWNHPRNLTDAQFDEIVRRKGLVGLNLVASHLGEQSKEQWERHLYHFWERDGVYTVALGGDMDGTALPAAWNGLCFWRELYEYLTQKGYPTYAIERLFFENCKEFLSHL